jgi:hypothetical protein
MSEAFCGTGNGHAEFQRVKQESGGRIRNVSFRKNGKIKIFPTNIAKKH